jgi:hypothetical protein
MNEENTQALIADYLRLHHPEVLFHSDFGSGTKLTMGQAVRQKRLNGGRRAWPDLFIAEPVPMRDSQGRILGMSSYGLFIELKREGEKLYPGARAKNRFPSIDGKEYKTEHLREQADVLYTLRNRGYEAEFAIGFDEAVKIIENYLSPLGRLIENKEEYDF